MWKLLLIALLLLSFVPAAADENGQKIYRTTDEEGNVIYTDEPPSEDAEPVELDPITTVPSITPETPPAQEAGRNEAGTAAGDYAGLEFVYPQPDQTIRHNGGNVPFRLTLQPEEATLAESHHVEILLDGEVRGSANALQVTVGPVNRGPHEVSARIVDAEGNTLVRTRKVAFFLLRHSVLTP